MANVTMEVEGIGHAICSTECLQDQEIQMRLFRSFRTTEITEEEIAEWKLIYHGVPRPKPEEWENGEAATWRDLVGYSGPGYRSPILTDEITEQEIDDWRSASQQIEKMNFAEIRKKYNVKFESENDQHADCDVGEGCDWLGQVFTNLREDEDFDLIKFIQNCNK